MIWLIVAICFLGAALYTGIAFGVKAWPFSKPAPSSNALGANDTPVSNTTGVVLTVLFMAVFLGLAFMSLKASIYRYDFAGRALAMGRPDLSFAAMAPEIGGGINRAFGGFGK